MAFQKPWLYWHAFGSRIHPGRPITHEIARDPPPDACRRRADGRPALGAVDAGRAIAGAAGGRRASANLSPAGGSAGAARARDAGARLDLLQPAAIPDGRHVRAPHQQRGRRLRARKPGAAPRDRGRHGVSRQDPDDLAVPCLHRRPDFALGSALSGHGALARPRLLVERHPGGAADRTGQRDRRDDGRPLQLRPVQRHVGESDVGLLQPAVLPPGLACVCGSRALGRGDQRCPRAVLFVGGGDTAERPHDPGDEPGGGRRRRVDAPQRLHRQWRMGRGHGAPRHDPSPFRPDGRGLADRLQSGSVSVDQRSRQVRAVHGLHAPSQRHAGAEGQLHLPDRDERQERGDARLPAERPLQRSVGQVHQGPHRTPERRTAFTSWAPSSGATPRCRVRTWRRCRRRCTSRDRARW